MEQRPTPVSALDVAAYILEKQPRNQPITAMKLQKLVYYSQAWALVWNEEPLFSESILAWANGPIVRELYDLHKGLFHITQLAQGNSARLHCQQKETIDQVLEVYGRKSAQWLSDLTHREDPWKKAREGLLPSERGNTEISLASMEEYYSSIPEEE